MHRDGWGGGQREDLGRGPSAVITVPDLTSLWIVATSYPASSKMATVFAPTASGSVDPAVPTKMARDSHNKHEFPAAVKPSYAGTHESQWYPMHAPGAAGVLESRGAGAARGPQRQTH